AAQQKSAEQQISGNPVPLSSVTADATGGTLPTGTLIWFGTDRHAEAAVVTGKGRYLMYDPNTGATTTRSTEQFVAYIKNKNAFVVQVASGPTKSECLCCVVM